MGKKNAGATEFHEVKRRVPSKQRRQVKFPLAVEAAFVAGRLLTQQTIGADGLAGRKKVRALARAVDDEEMVAGRIKLIGITAVGQVPGIGPRPQLLIENAKSQLLGSANITGIARQHNAQSAASGENHRARTQHMFEEFYLRRRARAPNPSCLPAPDFRPVRARI